MHSANSVLARAILETTPKIVTAAGYSMSAEKLPFHQWMLKKLEATFPTQTIFDYKTKVEYSYKKLAQLIRRCGKFYQSIKLQPNDYILFLGSNSFHYLALYFASICVGGVPLGVPALNCSLNDLRTRLIQHDIQYLVVDDSIDLVWIIKLIHSVSTIKNIIIYDSCTHGITEIPAKVKFFNEWLQDATDVMIPKEEMHQCSNTALWPCLGVSSTGTREWPPKIALYNHQSLVASVDTLANGKILEYRPIDQLLAFGSFAHLESLLMFTTGVASGCRLILLPTYHYRLVMEAIRNCKINLAMLPAHCIIRLTNDKNANLGNLCKIISYDGTLSMSICEAFFKHFPNVKSLRNCYLMAECPCPVSIMGRNSHEYDSVGCLLPNTRLKVTNSNGEVVEQNRSGYISFERHKSMFALGYLSNMSQQVIPLNLDLNECQSGDHRWLNTDDIGYFDDFGVIFIHGQYIDQSNVLLRKRETEIENILCSHPTVAEACAVQLEGKTWSAIVVPSGDHHVSTSHLTLYLFDKLGTSYVSEMNVFVKQSLWKTSSGRLVKSLIMKDISDFMNIKMKF